jgi:hypothetical protein
MRADFPITDAASVRVVSARADAQLVIARYVDTSILIKVYYGREPHAEDGLNRSKTSRL